MKMRANYAMPEMPLSENMRKMIESMGGANIVLVTEKTLYGTDVMERINMLSIPKRQVINEFLTEEEDELLEEKDQNGQMGSINTPLLDPSLRPCNVSLKKRVWIGYAGFKEETYSLNGEWMNVVQGNGLKVFDAVQLWAFRVGIGRRLQFALVKVAPLDDDKIPTWLHRVIVSDLEEELREEQQLQKKLRQSNKRKFDHGTAVVAARNHNRI